MKFVSGPNWECYAFLAFGVVISIDARSLWPIAIIPLSLLLHRWMRNSGRKMLKDYPDDPYIQKKYARYRDSAGK